MAGKRPSTFRQSIKRLGQKAANSRVLGRPTRIVASIYRLPEIRAAKNAAAANQQQLIEQQRQLSAQLAELQHTLVQVQDEQRELRRDEQNFAAGLPEGLREIARRVADIESKTTAP